MTSPRPCPRWWCTWRCRSSCKGRPTSWSESYITDYSPSPCPSLQISRITNHNWWKAWIRIRIEIPNPSFQAQDNTVQYSTLLDHNRNRNREETMGTSNSLTHLQIVDRINYELIWEDTTLMEWAWAHYKNYNFDVTTRLSISYTILHYSCTLSSRRHLRSLQFRAS
jgi:hypothetical protein